MPGRERGSYDARLDRFDVGVRALARACRFGQRALISEIGLTPEQRSEVEAAVAGLEHPLRTEAGVFDLLVACPFLLDLALLFLLRYQARTLPEGRLP